MLNFNVNFPVALCVSRKKEKEKAINKALKTLTM